MFTAIKNYFRNDKGILLRGDIIVFNRSSYLIVEATIIGHTKDGRYKTKISSIKNKYSGTYSDIADEWAREGHRRMLNAHEIYVLQHNDVIKEIYNSKIKSNLDELKNYENYWIRRLLRLCR